MNFLFIMDISSGEQLLHKASLYEKLSNYFMEKDKIESIIERYENGERKDFILENLQTHDWHLLKKSLEKLFPDIIVNAISKSSKSDNKEFLIVDLTGCTGISGLKIRNSFYSDKAKDLANFYGYTVSGITSSCIALEPEYPERVDDFLYNDCCGVCFHLCEKTMFKDSILKNGLRCRNRDDDAFTKSYRNWPKRIYVYATEFFKDKKILKDELETLANTISDGNNTLEDYIVLRIQFPNKGLLNRYNFYKDTLMDDSKSMFTYQNIPGEYISIMKI